MADTLLDSVAVGRRSGEDADRILTAYVQTGPGMVFNHTLESAPAAKAPNAAGSVDPLQR